MCIRDRYLAVRFNFSDEWKGTKKTVVFLYDGYNLSLIHIYDGKKYFDYLRTHVENIE